MSERPGLYGVFIGVGAFIGLVLGAVLKSIWALPTWAGIAFSPFAFLLGAIIGGELRMQ